MNFKILLAPKSIISPSEKKTKPENSCKNPWAALLPYFEAKIAVIVNLSIFSRIAIGHAEIKIIHFFRVEQDENQAIKVLSANIVVRERRPEHASTISRVVSAKWRIFPSRKTAIPIN